MANDIDLWQDMKHLENEGKQEEANSLLEIYRFRYLGDNKRGTII
jgi:hypothetical protein